MNRKQYRDAFDQLCFSADFSERTTNLLRQRAQTMESQKSERTEKEQNAMNWSIFRKPAALAAVAAMLVISVSAAVLWLTPSQVADHFDQPALSEAFQSDSSLVINQSIEMDPYTFTLLGLVSGANLTDFQPDTDATHTYAVAALKYTDGTPIENETYDFSQYTLTPLVSGYYPWLVNNWTLGSFVSGFAQDGVYYYLLDTQNLEIFADHTVYLAFYEGGSPSADLFYYAPDGSISFAENLETPHALFSLPLDSQKADPDAVQAFLDSTGLHFDPPDDSDTPQEAGDTQFTVTEDTSDPNAKSILIEPKN